MSYLDLLIDQAKEVTEKQDCSFSGGGGIHTLNGNMETIADIEDFNRHNTVE